MQDKREYPLLYPYGEARIGARIKFIPQDFRVSENLGFALSGSGEHLYLYVQKTGLTTQQLIEQLSQRVGIHPRHVGYSGLKDKHAVTQQWISLHLPGAKQVAEITDTDGYQVLQSQWHDKKLRVGVHRSNRFHIILRNVSGDIGLLESRLELIESQGMANYFGAQRFGSREDNVEQALRTLNNRHKNKRLSRHKKSLFLSALRSELFNRILCKRIQLGLWNTPVDGDVYMLAGSQSMFSASIDDTIRRRFSEFDIHSAISLYGCGEEKLTRRALQIEQEIFSSSTEICQTLCDSQIRRAYRGHRAVARQLDVDYSAAEKTIELQVELARGVYLTSLLAHFVVFVA